LAHAFVLSFQTLSLGIFFFSNIKKERKTQRKKIIEKKKCREGRELTFLLSLLHLG
jgi:hypothetical protein